MTTNYGCSTRCYLSRRYAYKLLCMNKYKSIAKFNFISS
jgi:hypothetical protein